jgi:hypothetical protein
VSGYKHRQQSTHHSLQGKAMSNANQGEGSRRRSLFGALVLGFIAVVVTAGAVSWATPDGNLVVTLTPALALGFVVFRLALWRLRRNEST